MKKKLLILTLIMFGAFAFFATPKNYVGVSASESKNTSVLENNSQLLSVDYLDFYSVPTAQFSFSGNGGAVLGNELSKAFDRNFITSFKSAIDNNVTYTNPDTGEQIPNFKNYIEVDFNNSVTINRLIYGSENGTTRGFATELNLYFDNGNGFELINSYITTETTQFVVFDFGKTITTTRFKFEFVKVSTKHKYVATAREIIFLQPECDEYNVYKNMFLDYTQTTLNESINTFDKLCEFEEKLKQNINFSVISTKIERAKMLAVNKIVLNKRREFSTDAAAENKIAQSGNIATYCRSTLQLNAFGTNRQVLGILANAGETINVFVDGKTTDPLPKIRFSQHMGSWRSWLGGELQLKLGKNTFTAPNFKYSDYTIDVPLGGAIYIVNPYTSAEQSSQVKVYIEGGTFYPVLTKNTNENIYKNELKEYAKKVAIDPQNVVDLTEIVTDHAIVTVMATKADELYENNSPAKAVDNWNKYMDALLEFGGIPQDPSDPLFDKRNLSVNFNVRLVQPWPGAGAFAHTEHVGVYESWQKALILGSGFGWGLSHEIGHMMDNPNRTIGESTNNMYAKYNETALEQLNARGDFSKTTNALTSDLTFDTEDYFGKNRLNFLVWWYIESWHKGYWAGLENCYRGLYPALKNFLSTDSGLAEKISSLTKTEKQVIYSSIVTGVDMSYYFDRWGYRVSSEESDKVFKTATVSDSFNAVMSKAVSSGFVNNTFKPKLWYQTNMAYHNTNIAPEYGNETAVSIASVSKTSSGYNIFINHTENVNHLGYEILEGDETNGYKVVGFTYGSAFLDTTEYASGYTPSYKIIAVDNTFNTSSVSSAKQPSENTLAVCKIGETNYTSLQQALNAVSDNDTIELLKSFETTNINMSKSVNIKVADSVAADIVLSKIEAGNFITIAQGVTVSIMGDETRKIVLNGDGFSQSGALLFVGGKVEISYVNFTNSVSAGDGAGVVMGANVSGSVFNNCEFTNITANTGAAYYCNVNNSDAVFNNCKFSNNTALSGGVIANKGGITLNVCEVLSNTAKDGVIKNFAGGILRANNCDVKNNTASVGAGYHLDGNTVITGGRVVNNTATTQAGGLYYGTNVNVRTVTINGTIFSNNSAPVGAEMLVLSGQTTLTNAVVGGLGEIRLNGGTMTVDSQSDLQATFAISSAASLIVSGGIFENINNCKFSFVNYVANMVVLKATGFNLTQSDLSKINIIEQNVKVVLSENAVLAAPNKVELTLIISGQTKVFECNYGDKVTLNYDIEPTKYIEKYVASIGGEYAAGYSFAITQNVTFTASVKNKLTAVFNYGNNADTIYFVPYEILMLPAKKTGNIKIAGWMLDGKYYKAGDTYSTNESCQFNAVYETLFKLIINNGQNDIYSDYFEYGETVDLATLVDAFDSEFYNENNVKINSVLVNKNITVKMLPKQTQNIDNLPDDNNSNTKGTNANKIISIVTIVFVCAVVIGLTIFYFIYKKKNKNK